MKTHTTARILTVLVVLLGVAAATYADQFGNPEEPALRPYRGLWRGLKAFTYNVVRSLDEGNHKFPGLGVVELGRGVRYGTVELVSSTYTGMMFSRPRPTKSYGMVNRIIDSDWLLRNAADEAGGAIFWAHWGAPTNFGAATATFAAQKVVDQSPVLSDREKDLYIKPTAVYTAQQEYLGERLTTHPGMHVNFLTRARREHVYVPTLPAVPPVPPGTGQIPGVAPGMEAPAPVTALPPVTLTPTPAPTVAPLPPVRLAPEPAPLPGTVEPAPLPPGMLPAVPKPAPTAAPPLRRNMETPPASMRTDETPQRSQPHMPPTPPRSTFPSTTTSPQPGTAPMAPVAPATP